MKKSLLLLLTLVPIAAGWLINALFFVPPIGMAAFYILPLLVLAFWFHLGRQYADTAWKALPSILIGNAVGIVSLALYVWQFIFETDETRNLSVAAFSQMFTAGTPMYLWGGIARLFETQPNYAGRTAMTALQVISLLVMMLVFAVGYCWQKKKCRADR